ncbi:hypothetical protein KY327_03520, partial [Candidatus Woesearchaeota archaeon]|nr:hypothetical protein [Candidatus Woesearchaeota archaeon]
MKRAQFLELDFLIALLILIAGILVLKGQYIHTYETPQVETAATDVNKLLRTTTLGDLDASYVANLQQELEGTNVNATNETSIARLAAMLYITGLNEGDTDLQGQARSLLGELSDQADISTSYNVTIHSNNQRYNLHTSTDPLNKTATTTRSLLSGFQVGQPLVGHTATAYLSKGGTTRHAITRIGGFIGQGNITLQLDIPDHAYSIQDLYLEGNFH